MNNWLDIQDIVKEDFLHVITKEEIIHLVKIFDVNIPGFSKRIDVAPFPMLKSRFENYLKKIPLEGFFKTYIKDVYEEFKDEEYEEGIKKIASNNKLKNTEVIALLGVLYPTKYTDLRKDFKRYLDDSDHILANVVDLEISDILHSIINYYRPYVKKIYDSIEWPSIKSDPKSLQAYLKSEYELESSVATTLYFTDQMNKFDLTDEENHLLYELAIFELLKLHSKTNSKIKELEEKNNNMKNKYNNLMKQTKTMKHNKENEILNVKKIYKEKIKDKDRLINYLKNQREQELYEQSIQVKKLNKEIESLQERMFREKQTSYNVINKKDKILLFTDRAHEFDKMVEKELLKDLESLEEYLISYDNDNLLFVDVFGMGTSSKQKIRRMSKKNKSKIKILNGSSLNIIRNIIYYIEGAGLN